MDERRLDPLDARRIHLCTASDLHPYECDGPGRCVHCDHTITETHDPELCALCDPAPQRDAAPKGEALTANKETETSVP